MLAFIGVELRVNSRRWGTLDKSISSVQNLNFSTPCKNLSVEQVVPFRRGAHGAGRGWAGLGGRVVRHFHVHRIDGFRPPRVIVLTRATRTMSTHAVGKIRGIFKFKRPGIRGAWVGGFRLFFPPPPFCGLSMAEWWYCCANNNEEPSLLCTAVCCLRAILLSLPSCCALRYMLTLTPRGLTA